MGSEELLDAMAMVAMLGLLVNQGPVADTAEQAYRLARSMLEARGESRQGCSGLEGE